MVDLDIPVAASVGTDLVVPLVNPPDPATKSRPANQLASAPGPGSTLVKRKHLSPFGPIMEAIEKSTTMLVDAMDHMKIT